MDPEDDGLVPFGANPFDPHFASNSPFSFGAHSITSPQHDPPNFYTKPWAPYGFPPPAGLPPHRFPPPPPPPPPQGFMSPPGGFSTPDLQSYTGPPYPPYYAHNYGNVDAFTSVPDGYFRSSPALYPYPRPTRAPSPPLEPPRSPSLPRAPPTVRFASPPEYPQLRGFPRPLSLSPPPPPRPRDRSRSSPLFRRERSLERSSRSRSTSLPSTLTSDEWEEYPGSTPAKSQAQSRNESRPSWLSSTSLITPSVPRPVPARQPPSYPIAHPVPPSRVSSFPLPQVAGFQRPQRADLDWHQFNRVVPLSGGRNGRKSKGAKKSDGNGSPTWRKDKFPKHRNLVWNPTSSYGHPGQWPDTESTTREGRNQALYVLESKCYTDHNGDQTTDLTCAATGPELGEMGDEIQFQWLHLQRQTMSLDEMQRFVQGARGLTRTMKALGTSILDEINRVYVKQSTHGRYVEPGTVLRHVGQNQGPNSPAVVFASFPYFAISDRPMAAPSAYPDVCPTRSLMETLYLFESVEDRDENQALHRYLKWSKSNLLLVPQIWVILLGSDTMITCSQSSRDDLLGQDVRISPTHNVRRIRIQMLPDLNFSVLVGTSMSFYGFIEQIELHCANVGIPWSDCILRTENGEELTAEKWLQISKERVLPHLRIYLRRDEATTTRGEAAPVPIAAPTVPKYPAKSYAEKTSSPSWALSPLSSRLMARRQSITDAKNEITRLPMPLPISGIHNEVVTPPLFPKRRPLAAIETVPAMAPGLDQRYAHLRRQSISHVESESTQLLRRHVMGIASSMSVDRSREPEIFLLPWKEGNEAQETFNRDMAVQRYNGISQPNDGDVLGEGEKHGRPSNKKFRGHNPNLRTDPHMEKNRSSEIQRMGSAWLQPRCCICRSPSAPQIPDWECPWGCESQMLWNTILRAEQNAIRRFGPSRKGVNLNNVQNDVALQCVKEITDRYRDALEPSLRHAMDTLKGIPYYAIYIAYQGNPPLSPDLLYNIRYRIALLREEHQAICDHIWDQHAKLYPEVANRIYMETIRNTEAESHEPKSDSHSASTFQAGANSKMAVPGPPMGTPRNERLDLEQDGTISWLMQNLYRLLFLLPPSIPSGHSVDHRPFEDRPSSDTAALSTGRAADQGAAVHFHDIGREGASQNEADGQLDGKHAAESENERGLPAAVSLVQSAPISPEQDVGDDPFKVGPSTSSRGDEALQRKPPICLDFVLFHGNIVISSADSGSKSEPGSPSTENRSKPQLTETTNEASISEPTREGDHSISDLDDPYPRSTSRNKGKQIQGQFAFREYDKAAVSESNQRHRKISPSEDSEGSPRGRRSAGKSTRRTGKRHSSPGSRSSTENRILEASRETPPSPVTRKISRNIHATVESADEESLSHVSRDSPRSLDTQTSAGNPFDDVRAEAGSTSGLNDLWESDTDMEPWTHVEPRRHMGRSYERPVFQSRHSYHGQLPWSNVSSDAPSVAHETNIRAPRIRAPRVATPRRPPTSRVSSRLASLDLESVPIPPFFSWATESERFNEKTTADPWKEEMDMVQTIHRILSNIYENLCGDPQNRDGTNFNRTKESTLQDLEQRYFSPQLARVSPASSAGSSRNVDQPENGTPSQSRPLSPELGGPSQSSMGRPTGKTSKAYETAVPGGVLYPVRQLLVLQRQFINLYLPVAHDHRLVQKVWGAFDSICEILYGTYEICVQAKNAGQRSRTGSWMVVETSVKDFSQSEDELMWSKSTKPLWKCESCMAATVYKTRSDVITHLGHAHRDLAWSENSKTSERIVHHLLIREDADVRNIWKLEEMVSLMNYSITLFESLFIKAKSLQDGVTDTHLGKPDRYQLPPKVVQSFERNVLFVAELARCLKNIRGSYRKWHPKLWKRPGQILNELWPQVYNRAAEIRYLLDGAETDLVLMNRTDADRNSVSLASVGPEFIIGIIFRTLRSQVLYEDKDVMDVYRSFAEKLNIEVNQRPRKKLLLDVNRLQEEFEAVKKTTEGQSIALEKLAMLLTQITIGLPFADRTRSHRFQYENALLNKEGDELWNWLQELQAWDARMCRLRNQIRQSIEILEEGHGKAILVFTTVTIVFLPLSFISSFFGMNTADIRNLDNSQTIF